MKTMQIYADYFTGAIKVHNGHVVDAAPIIKYLIHKDIEEVQTYCHRKGWNLFELH